MADFGDTAFSLFGSGEGGSPFSGSYGLTSGGGGGLSLPTDFGLTSSVAPAASGGGGGDFWSSLASGTRTGLNTFGDVAKAILPAAQIGSAGYGIYSGIQGADQLATQTKLAERAGERQDQIAGQAQAQAAPVAEFGQEQLRRAGLGEVPPAIRASIDQWKQSAIQRINQQAASSGQAGSTQHQQWLMWVDQNAQAMEASALQDMQRTGLAAAGTAGNLLGVGGGAAAGAGQAAAQQQGSLQGLIGEANKALASLSAGAR
jgi:hypothetical protein